MTMRGEAALMKPMNEKHLAVLLEMIAIHTDLASEELGKAVLNDRTARGVATDLRFSRLEAA